MRYKFTWVVVFSFLLVGCEWNTPDLREAGPTVIYSDANMSGTSRAVLFNNQVHFLVSYDAKINGVASYPDKGAYWHKIKLASETSSNVVTFESASVADNAQMSDLTISKDNKLGVVYQAPTGQGFGFRMPYHIWDGQKLTSSTIFPNANLGSWPRIQYNNSNLPVVCSFAFACYALWYHYLPTSSGTWASGQMTNCGEPMTNAQMVFINNVLYVATSAESQVPYKLKVFSVENNAAAKLVESSQNISSMCAIASVNNGYKVLALLDDKLLLGSGGNYETVAAEKNIYHRATVFYDDAGVATVAFQTDKVVSVVRKVGSVWKTIYQHNIPLSSLQQSWTRGPSLLLKNNSLVVVYNDDTKVYLKKLP